MKAFPFARMGGRSGGDTGWQGMVVPHPELQETATGIGGRMALNPVPPASTQK